MTSPLTFDPQAHEYTHRGSVVPHVTGILKDMRVSPPYPADRGWLEFGRAVHKGCERLLLGTLPTSDDPDNRYPHTSVSLWPYLDACRQKIQEYRVTLIRTEFPVYHDLRGFAGTLDLQCVMLDGRDEAIWDLKTGRPPECTALQLAAYDLALNRTLGLPERHRPRRRFALHLFDDEVKETGRARLTEFTDPFDYDAFIGILDHWKWLNKKGMKREV